jgi:xanthine dehydrogenase YagR molybdenum-binding subunit
MNKVIGEPHPRIDARLKVTGAARYSGDNNFPNLAFGYLLKSTIASGSIRSIDTAEADSAPGIIAIFTPFRSLKLYAPLDRTEGVISGDGFAALQDNRV